MQIQEQQMPMQNLKLNLKKKLVYFLFFKKNQKKNLHLESSIEHGRYGKELTNEIEWFGNKYAKDEIEQEKILKIVPIAPKYATWIVLRTTLRKTMPIGGSTTLRSVATIGLLKIINKNKC